MTKPTGSGIALVLLLLLAWGLPAQAETRNLLVNGSFETGDLTGWSASAGLVAGGGMVYGFEVLQGGAATLSGGMAPGGGVAPAAAAGTWLLEGFFAAGGMWAPPFAFATYQDVHIPANATSAVFSGNFGAVISAGGDATDIARLDVVDLSGSLDTAAYTGGTVHTFTAYDGSGGAVSAWGAITPVELLATGTVSPGDTVRVRIFNQMTNVLAFAIADNLKITITTADAPPGGYPNNLGGGGPNDPPLLPPGSSGSTLPGQEFIMDRTFPLAALGQTNGTNDALDTQAESIPGLRLLLTFADGSESSSFLPLAGSGSLDNGILWETTFGTRYGFRSTSLNMVWPVDALAAMPAGDCRIAYWLQDPSGPKSNPRWEYLTISNSSSGESGDSLVPAEDPTEITLKLMVSTFDLSDQGVTRVASGACVVESNGATSGTFAITEGLVEAQIPFGTTSTLSFLSDTGQLARVRVEFENGLAIGYDEEHGEPVLGIYENLEGGSYAFEYYQDRVYICNQAEAYGPVVGPVYGTSSN